MKSLLRHFRQLLDLQGTREPVVLEVRIFRLTCLLVAVATLVLLLPINCLQGLPPAVNVGVAIVGLVSLWCYRESLRGVHRPGLLVLVTVGLMNPVWFLNGGIEGSVTLYFLPCLFYVLALFRGRVRWIGAGLLLFDIWVLHVLGHLFPGLVVKFLLPVDRLTDVLSGLAICGAALGGMAWIVLSTYDWERRRLIRAEADLRAEKALSDAVINGLPGVFYMFDREGALVRWNEEYARELGGGAEALAGRRLLDCVVPEDRERTAAAVRRAYEEGRATVQAQCRSVAGPPVSYHLAARRLQVGDRLFLVGTGYDVSERKRAEDALRASEERHRRLIRNLHAGVVVHGTDTAVILANDQASVLLGFSTDQLLGKLATDPAWRFVRENGVTLPPEEYPVNRVLARGEPLRDLVVGVDCPGRASRVWALINAFAEKDRSGAVQQVVITFLDITQRKALEERLRQAQKMEAIGQLAGGIAHDFNNMLASTMLHLSLLRERTDLGPEVQEALAELAQDAKRTADLTRQLLMLSRRSVLEVCTLDLDELVDRLLRMLRRLIGEQIQVDYHPPSFLPSVEADPGMIEQVLMNLCVNARDAMPNGGRLVVRLDAVEADAARVSTHPGVHPGLFVCLIVEDTGCGMNEATLARLFEPFFTTKDVGKGTGLGLATVHGIVGQHRGWVEVESQLGVGSTFRVFLPALPLSKPASLPAHEPEAVRGHGTILLAEDEPGLRQIAARGLRSLGYSVFEAANGREALSLWAEHQDRIDLLLSDMMMPEGMTGLDLARQLQARKPGLKVIISTGYSTEIVDHHFLLAPDLVRLQKPYHIQTLSQTVRKCLEQPIA